MMQLFTYSIASSVEPLVIDVKLMALCLVSQTLVNRLFWSQTQTLPFQVIAIGSAYKGGIAAVLFDHSLLNIYL